MATAEEAVRSYLRYLHDPESFLSEMKDIDDRIKRSEDPIERLRLQNERVSRTNPGPKLEDDFITHAKAWAQEHNISGQAFLAEGVQPAVLSKAGLVRGRGTTSTTRQRAARVSADDIRKSVTSRRKEFTIKDIQAATGGSAGTVRKVLSEMSAAGEVTEVGPAPDHTGPGRAPILYRKA